MPADQGRHPGTSPSPQRRTRRRSGAAPAGEGGTDGAGAAEGAGRLSSPRRSARLAPKYAAAQYQQQMQKPLTGAIKASRVLVTAEAVPAAGGDSGDAPPAPAPAPALAAPAVAAGADREAAALLPSVSAAGLLHTPRRQRRSWGLRGQSAVKLAWEHSWLSYEEIPAWMRDNSLILGRYRPQMTLRQALGSLWSLHNESFNTWSHIIGALAMVALMFVTHATEPAPQDQSTAALPPKWPLYLALAAILYGYCASAAAHLLHVVDQRLHDLLWSLDHAAIALSCATSFTPVCMYAFACRQGVAPMYITVTALLAAAVIAVSNLRVFHQPSYRPVRAAVQLSLGLWAQLPLLHATYLLRPYPAAFACVMNVYRSIGIMVLGVGIYAGRLTESLMPGRVDLIGSSHNIMHALAVPAHIVFTRAAQDLWVWRGSSEGVCEATGSYQM